MHSKKGFFLYTYCFVDRENAHSIWSLIDTIAVGLLESGNRVIFCRFCDNAERINRDVPEGVQVRDVRVPVKRSAISLLSQVWGFGKDFRDILRQERVDIVHTHFALPGAIARWVAHRERVPVVLTTHHEIYGSMNFHWRWALRVTQHYCDAAVYISDQVEATYLSLVGRAKTDSVIKNGIDVSSLSEYRALSSSTTSTPHVICPGRFVSVKGQACLIEAWPKVLERFPSATLCLAGEGPDGPKLMERCRVLGITESVEFPGWLLKVNMLELASAASLMVVPSDGTQEGFGLVVAEAMALGTPLVCSDIPVFREVVADTAHYFPVGNADALAKAIIDTLSHPEKAHELAGKARKRVEENFDQRDMVAAYLRLYEKLITRNHNA